MGVVDIVIDIEGTVVVVGVVDGPTVDDGCSSSLSSLCIEM